MIKSKKIITKKKKLKSKNKFETKFHINHLINFLKNLFVKNQISMNEIYKKIISDNIKIQNPINFIQ